MYEKNIAIVPLKLLLGTEDGIDCSSSALEDVIEAKAVPFDADIAGLGVLIGFLFTALLAFSILLVAYATYSIPPRLINEVDAVLARAVRRKFAFIRDKLHLSRFLRGRTVGTDKRDDRIRTFTTFMLSVSDQILVSEIAILIAALVGFQEITVYSVNIIIALGVLASTVHLATLPLLVERLAKHNVAKALRIFMMVIGAGMLIFLLIIQLSSTWYESVYFQCGFKDFDVEPSLDFFVFLTVPMGVLYGTYEVIRMLYKYPKDLRYEGKMGKMKDTREDETNQGREFTYEQGQSGGRPAGDIVTQRQEDETREEQQRDGRIEGIETQVIGLEGRLDSNQVPRQDIVREREEIVELRPMRSIDIEPERSVDREPRSTVSHTPTQAGAGAEDTSKTHDRDSRDNKSRLLREVKGFYQKWKYADISDLLRQRLQLKAREILLKRLSKNEQEWHTIRLAESWAFHECHGSFMWRILWLWSGNVYGTAAVFTAQSDRTGMSGNPYKMGFGQIVPLALLLLPIFTALQSLADYWEDIRDYAEDPERNQISDEDGGLGKHRENNHPSLTRWAEGQKPTCSKEVKRAIFLYTLFMALFTTAFGLVFAVDFVPEEAIRALFFIMLIIEVRKIYGLCHLFVFTFRNNRDFEIESQRQFSSKDQAQRMMMANGAEDIAPEPEEAV